MNFSQYDSYSGLFHFPTESPLCDFQENGSLLMGCQMIDPIGPDDDSGWLDDDKFGTTIKSTSGCLSKDSPYPQRTSLLGIKRRKITDLPKSEPLVTKTNHFIYKDDFTWNDSKELPDVILVSPRRETTPERELNTNTFFNLDEEKPNDNVNLDFDNALRNVQVEVGMDYSVDLVTKEDVEYLDSLLAGFSDQPVQNSNGCIFDDDVDSEDSEDDVPDQNSFNEISCNINQQSATTDSQSAIRKLLKNDSFQGNFCMKKSTEVLSEIDQYHDCFAEHNYFSPSKASKPRIDTNSETPVRAVEKPKFDSACVPVVTQDYVVETEISSTPENSFELKTPRLVLPQCTPEKKSTKASKNSKHRDASKKPSKSTISKSYKDDPTYRPHTKKPLPKKTQLPKSKAVVKPKPVALPIPTSNCDIAKLPRIPLKSSSGESMPRIPPAVVPKTPSIFNFVNRKCSSSDPVPIIEPDPVHLENPPTPLASPTRDDFTDQDEFMNQDSSQPETQKSNVDIVDPIKPVEPAPKVEKKKISLTEYLKKRAIEITPDPEPMEKSEPVESIPQMPMISLEDIEKAVLKSKPPPPVVKSQKPEPKSEPTPAVVKSESRRPKLSKPMPKPRRNPAIELKQQPKERPVIELKQQPKERPVIELKQHPKERPAIESKQQPKERQIIESKQQPKEQKNAAPLKLIKLAIPDKAPTARSVSLSPNEVSQSLDSCDRYSSSGVSSYHNSSVSSICGSPFTGQDDKSNDTKYFDNERVAASKANKPTVEKKLPEIPFAVNKELLRKDRSSRRHKHRRDKHRRSDSITRKRKLSDSCFEDDSDCSDYSDRKRSRKRYNSSSSSSSEKSYHHRSQNLECSISPRSYREFCDWKYSSQQDLVPEPYFYPDFNELPPNMYYHPVPPPAAWHPDFGPYYPPFPPNVEVPYFYSGSHEPPMDTGEVEVDRRALFVGNIEDSLDEKELKRRFESYGDITHVKLHFREDQKSFGFVYFTEERYVQKAIKFGKEDPDLSRYKLGVGMRRDRCADRRSFAYEKKIPVPNFPHPSYREDPFNLKLEKFKNDLKQRKLNDRYK